MKKNSCLIALIALVMCSCVPSKKYNELLQSQQQCADELAKYKTLALDNEGKAKNLQAQYDEAAKDVAQLKQDTASMGEKFRLLQMDYDKAVALNQVYEDKLEKTRSTGARQVASLHNDLEERLVELQQKENALNTLKAELDEKTAQLKQREARVNELEAILAQKDKAVSDLKDKISKALLGFQGKGLTVQEKNGKIYVSLEAKLLFASGSTLVDGEGKKALVDLAQALESNSDWEVVVEGHTDTDPLKSANSPKDNWELSVLRATSVVKIMLENSHMDPKTLVASGRSEYYPVDPNDKSKNRRIEVIIAPKLDKLFELLNGKE